MKNPTIVVITDRNDLNDQLFATFSMCRDLIRQTPVQADSREDLQRALSRASGGVIFTTIQKFAPEKGGTYPPDLEDAAVRGVLAQAEALLSGLSVPAASFA